MKVNDKVLYIDPAFPVSAEGVNPLSGYPEAEVIGINADGTVNLVLNTVVQNVKRADAGDVVAGTFVDYVDVEKVETAMSQKAIDEAKREAKRIDDEKAKEFNKAKEVADARIRAEAQLREARPASTPPPPSHSFRSPDTSKEV